MKTRIKVLESNRFVAKLGVATEGDIAKVIKANIKWVDDGIYPFYVKIYNNTKQISNEITGWLLASNLGLPQPQKAGLLVLPKEMQSNGIEVAWVCSEYGSKTPKTILHTSEDNIQEIIDMINNWPYAPNVLAFDDFIANTDRNIGNLVIQSKDNIGIIDHGESPVTGQWLVNSLQPNISYKNIILDLLSPPYSLELQKTKADKAIQEQRKHAKCLDEVKPELIYWWNILLGDNPDDKNALECFLKTRASNSQNRLAKNLGLLDLQL